MLGSGAEFRTPENELFHFGQRVSVAAVLVLVCFVLLFLRFFWLQVVDYGYYSTRAEENRISLVPIVPNRGLIVDRNGEVLARNYSAYTLEIVPDKVPDLEATIAALSMYVDIQPRDRKRFKKLMEETRNFESLPLRTRLSDEEVARFVARRFEFPGVEIKARLFRQYPYGDIASHALGYISRVNDRDIATIEEARRTDNYRGTDHFGKTGLEQKYEFVLHGQTGYEEIEVDAAGQAVRMLSRTAASPGNTLQLNLDMALQVVAERAFGDRRGALVALDPTTGGVLAFVSKPGYDPNLFIDGIDSQNWDVLNTSPEKPLLNRAINGLYPPGSTFKPFMAIAALETGKRTTTQKISDPGYFVFGNHVFRDDKAGGHGEVDMYTSIVQSCDTYYYMLANELGIDGIAREMAPFGFGQKTGLDMEGESEGVLPSQEWKKKRFKRADQQKWFAGETVSIAIGQGYNSYTPMQLALATATLANKGVMMRPRLVEAIENPATNEREEIAPEVVRTLDLQPKHLEFIKHAMVGVNKEGTSARAFAGATYTVAGKTGTAQVIAIKQNEKYDEKKIRKEHRDHALYIAFAPAEDPKIALAVVVENGGFGAQSAAPIARLVLDQYLLGKTADGPAAVVDVGGD